MSAGHGTHSKPDSVEPDGTHAYITNQTGDTVSVISTTTTNTVTDTICAIGTVGAGHTHGGDPATIGGAG